MRHEVPPSQQMFQLITGYWVSQCVGVFARHGLADALADGPRSAASLAEGRGLDAPALHRVLRALASVGVLDQRGEAFALTPLGATLRGDVPGSLAGMAVAQTSAGHWLPWGRLDRAVATGARTTVDALGGEIFEHYARHPDEARAFSAAMGGMSAMVSREVTRVAAVPEGARVLDAGGADGTLVAAVLDAHPTATGVLLDLPHVVDAARQNLSARGLSDRCEVVAGDFFTAVPDADVALLKHVLHDWDDARCAALLGSVAAALRPGGRVYIIEMVVPEDGSPSPAALMDVNMLVLVPGRERTAREYGALLDGAGLALRAVHPTHSPFQVIEASTR